MTSRIYKPRKRYVAVLPTRKVSAEAVEAVVKNNLVKLYGLEGLVSSGFRRIASSRGLVFASKLEWMPKTVLAITLVREIDSTPLVLKTVKTSGTIKGLWTRHQT